MIFVPVAAAAEAASANSGVPEILFGTLPIPPKIPSSDALLIKVDKTGPACHTGVHFFDYVTEFASYPFGREKLDSWRS